MKRPLTCVNLIKAIGTLSVGQDPVRLSRAIANVIVAQMLPDGVVKGGSSLLFRYGRYGSRYTRDIDTARVMELEAYLKQLNEALSHGWNGFTGRLVAVEPPQPVGVPSAYVMMPYDIKLNYCERPWQTIRIEIGQNEIGDADEFETSLPSDLADVFEKLSFPQPKPLPVMKLAYQIAQKLHAVSEPGSERAHDLIDLQLICNRSLIDYVEVKDVCQRLFDYRRRQTWPAVVTALPSWDDLYVQARNNLLDNGDVLPTAAEAVTWAN
jgi:hypothetical protein